MVAKAALSARSRMKNELHSPQDGLKAGQKCSACRYAANETFVVQFREEAVRGLVADVKTLCQRTGGQEASARLDNVMAEAGGQGGLELNDASGPWAGHVNRRLSYQLLIPMVL